MGEFLPSFGGVEHFVAGIGFSTPGLGGNELFLAFAVLSNEFSD